MLCRKCGAYVNQDDILCPSCGALLDKHGQESGVRAIRQGRKQPVQAQTAQEERTSSRRRRSGASHPYDEVSSATGKVYVDPSLSGGSSPEARAPYTFQAAEEPRHEETGFARPGRRVYAGAGERTGVPGAHAPKRRPSVHKVSRHMVNWAHMAIYATIAVVLLAVGAYLYITRTAEGQRILARMGKETTATALWEVGEEHLDVGEIDSAIADFLKARELDGEANVNVDGLLLLGSAYEANGMVEEAMALYEELYTKIVPNRPEAYRSMIRLLQAQDRDPEAAVLMQTAYEMTEITSFRTMRAELLPQAPMAGLTAGLYSEKKNLPLSSPQGYDVYYTMDEDAVLPQEGTLYTGPIFLDEGIWSVRAVAVSEDLVSDELRGTYKIIMPSPQTPGCTLAPDTYEQRQRVRLRVGEENKNDTDITLYYTIDGSMPDADSPIYTGEPIVLPTGNVTLKAVAVNGYGKVSNALEVTYKILAKPYPLTSYTAEDTVSGLVMGSTTREKVIEKFGEGKSTEETAVPGFETPGEKVTYDWGYAVFVKPRKEWVLAELYFTTTALSGPRDTGIGSSESDVVGQFRDMGQVAGASGSRGLYESTKGKGKIYPKEDGKEIRYVAENPDGTEQQLTYTLNKTGTVTAIRVQYAP